MRPFANLETAKEAIKDIASGKSEPHFITYRRYGRQDDIEYYVVPRHELPGYDMQDPQACEDSQYILYRYSSGKLKQINEVQPLLSEKILEA